MNKEIIWGERGRICSRELGSSRGVCSRPCPDDAAAFWSVHFPLSGQQGKKFWGLFWEVWGLPFSFPSKIPLEMTGAFAMIFLALH